MRAKASYPIAGGSLIMLLLITSPVLRAQEVIFQLSPTGLPGDLPTGGLNDVLTPVVVVVPPGTVVSYELAVFVQSTPAFPNVGGLGAFVVDILTDTGLLQPPLTAFDSRILTSFTVNTSLGVPVEDDIIGISGTQDLTGFFNTGVGLGARQVIGTGQLRTPTVEGDFQVSPVGAAQILVSGITTTPTLQTATVGIPRGFTIQTRQDVIPPDNGIPDDGRAADFGASLVNLCLPGVAAVLPACLAGLFCLRHCGLRRR
ncbi:MAG TPA: hypothetical protein PKL76_12900 [Phycisphaerae bacterium]|nr:hypothetical protein [Phycisphaerae bacterium]